MNATNVVTGDFQSASTNTITVSGGTASGMGVYDQNYYYWPNYSSPNYWYPQYMPSPVVEVDEVAELAAWLDGYLDGRKLTEKALKRIRQKLEDFSG